MVSKIRVNKVALGGQVYQPRVMGDCVYFLLQNEKNRFQCVCSGKTAENFKRHISHGDEITIEGNLCLQEFRKGQELITYQLVEARYISYGQKKADISPNDSHI